MEHDKDNKVSCIDAFEQFRMEYTGQIEKYNQEDEVETLNTF